MEDLAFRLGALILVYSAIAVVALSIQAAIIKRKQPKTAKPSTWHLPHPHHYMREPFYELLFRRHSHPTHPLP